MTLRWPSIPRRAAPAFLGWLVCFALGGCVDPKGRFDDFVARPLAVLEAGTPPDDTVEAGDGLDAGDSTLRMACQELLAQNLDGQYYASCFPTTAAPFALAINEKVTPSADGTTGTLDFSFTPIQIAATNTSQTAGDLVTLPPTTIDEQCSFVERLDTLTLPKEANALDRDLVAENAFLRGRFLSTERSCAGMEGTVTLINLVLHPSIDHCIFIRTPPGSPIPAVTSEDYLCDPGPLSNP